MARSTSRSHIDPALIAEIIDRLRLSLLGMSEAIYGGDCPLCGHAKSFSLWAASGNFRCFYCGADGRFVVSVERRAAIVKQKREKLITMED